MIDLKLGPLTPIGQTSKGGDMLAPVATAKQDLTGKAFDQTQLLASQLQPQDLIGHTRCVYSGPSGQQCDRWIKLTPSMRTLCDEHDPSVSKTATAVAEQVSIIDLQNKFRGNLAKYTYEDLMKHIAGIEEKLEETKVELYVGKAIAGEMLAAMSDDQRQKVRRAYVPKGSDGNTAKSSKPAGTKADKPSPMDQRVAMINEIFIGQYKMNAQQAEACYNIASKNKMDPHIVAKMLLGA